MALRAQTPSPRGRRTAVRRQDARQLAALQVPWSGCGHDRGRRHHPGPGKDLTGITWGGPALPTTNYELTLQARRLEGRDFFAGMTFPVGDSFCSLILGGWGGTIVGLSSIDGIDASENSTSQSIDFELQRWYRVRIRVTPEKIESWLDDKQIVDLPLKNRQIGVRIEVEPSQPLGMASWRTKGALRDIRLRRL